MNGGGSVSGSGADFVKGLKRKAKYVEDAFGVEEAPPGATSPVGATPLQQLLQVGSQQGTSTLWQTDGFTSVVLPDGDDTIPISKGVAAMMALAGFKTQSAAAPVPSPTGHELQAPIAREATATSHTAPSLPFQQSALALVHSGNTGPWAPTNPLASVNAGPESNLGVAGADVSVSCSGPQAPSPSAGTAATLEQQQQTAQMQLQQLQSFGSIGSMDAFGGLASLSPAAGISGTNAMAAMSSLANLQGISAGFALHTMPGMSAAAGMPGTSMGPLGAAGTLMGLGATDLLFKGDGGVPETLEQLLELQQGAAAAQQVQLLQQQQFRSQLRSFEAQQVAKGGGSSAAVARFKDKHRPMQMCRKLREFGYCVRGEECGFAHDTSELHPASAEFPDEGLGQDLLAQQVVPFLNSDAPMQMRKKREMCIRLNKGGCLLNERCMYAHSPKELGTVALVITEDRVKIRICRHWEQGKCSYGNWCVNAHGMKEIGKMKPPEEFCPADRQARRE